MIQVRVEQVLLVVRVPRVYFDFRYLAHSIPIRWATLLCDRVHRHWHDGVLKRANLNVWRERKPCFAGARIVAIATVPWSFISQIRRMSTKRGACHDPFTIHCLCGCRNIDSPRLGAIGPGRAERRNLENLGDFIGQRLPGPAAARKQFPVERVRLE